MDLETRSLERIHRLFEVLKLSIRLKLEYIKFDPDSLDDSEEDVRTNLRLLRRDFKRLLQIPTGRAQMGELLCGEERCNATFSRIMSNRQLAMQLQSMTISEADSEDSHQHDTGSMPAMSERAKGKQREIAKEPDFDAFEETTSCRFRRNGRVKDATGAEARGNTSQDMLESAEQWRTATKLDADAYEETTSRPLRRIGRNKDATGVKGRGNTSKKILGKNEMAKELDTDAFREITSRRLRRNVRTNDAISFEERGTTSQSTLGNDDTQWEEEFDDDAFAVVLSLPPRSGLIEDGTSAEKRFQCCACMEMRLKKHTVTLACGHEYCRICHVSLFRNAIADPTLFPPQCCGVPLPLDMSLPLLPGDLVKKFDLKAEELATPNPTHCSNADCAEFIRSQEIEGDVGTCPFCGEETCVQCKSKSHEGFCQSDPEVQRLMDAAKRSRWQLCTKCRNMVALSSGCFHMTYVSEHRIDDGSVTYNGRCRCKHEFCYLCGAQWKRCACPKSDDNYRYRPTPRAGDYHVCDFRRVNGQVCDGCGAAHLRFVMRCDGCQTANCWPCIRQQHG
jgi:E3 ubiquitin-protein ligase RNF144